MPPVTLHSDHIETNIFQTMPLPNIQLLVRPQPGGLEDHRKFITDEINSHAGLEDSRISDMVITSSVDGESVSCSQYMIGKFMF